MFGAMCTHGQYMHKPRKNYPYLCFFCLSWRWTANNVICLWNPLVIFQLNITHAEYKHVRGYFVLTETVC